jgi:hypothetical protein
MFSQLHPHRTASENQVEFAPLMKFLSLLAKDTEYVSQLKECASAATELTIVNSTNDPNV